MDENISSMNEIGNENTSGGALILVLLVLGLLIRLAVLFSTLDLSVQFYSGFVLRGLSIAFDMVIGYVVYLLVKWYTPGSRWRPVLFAALWLLNPAVIYISAVWGVMEPMLVLITLMVFVLARGKVYSVALVLILPAVFQLRPWIMSEHYGTAGAFNFFALVGGFNWPLYSTFLEVSHSVWVVVFAVAIIGLVTAALFRDFKTGNRNYFLIIGTYFILLFIFHSDMTALELFPGLVFLLLHASQRRDARVVGLYLAFSVTLLLNARQYLGSEHWYYFSRDHMVFCTILNPILGVALALVLINSVWPRFKWFAPAHEGGIPVKYYIWMVLAAGFFVRLAMVLHVDFAFGFDVGLFTDWAISIYEQGFHSYYGNPQHIFTDYPPVYLYVLYVIAAIRSFFEWDRHGTAFKFILFLPAILCDLGIGYVLYRRALKTQKPTSRAALPAILAAFWVFNPAIILISSLWGQVESVFVLALILSLLLVKEKKLFAAYVVYGIAILTKPQSLFLGPVYLYSAIAYFQENKVRPRTVLRFAGWITMAVGVMVLLFLPFHLPRALETMISSMNERPFGTVNAYNLFYLLGGNWQPVYRNYFMGVRYDIIGYFVVANVILLSMIALFIDGKTGGRNFFFIAAAIFALLYVFSVRMLDRYLFPALPLLLLHVIDKRDRRVMGLYLGFSATFFFNCFVMLLFVNTGDFRWEFPRAVAMGNVMLGMALFYMLTRDIAAGLREALAARGVRGDGVVSMGLEELTASEIDVDLPVIAAEGLEFDPEALEDEL